MQDELDQSEGDELRVYRERLREFLQRDTYRRGDGIDDVDRAYRRGWADAMSHVTRHVG